MLGSGQAKHITFVVCFFISENVLYICFVNFNNGVLQPQLSANG